jgi:predicted ATPase
MLGYPDQAVRSNDEALALADQMAHPYTVAFARSFAAILYQFLRDERGVREWAEAGINLSSERGFGQWMVHGMIMQGWVMAQQGQGGEVALAQMSQAIDAWRSSGAELAWPYYLALLAEAYAKTGQAEKGLAVLTEALAVTEQRGEKCWQPELYRLMGELRLIQGEAGAEAWFRQAIEIACQQGAKAWELRAVVSLSRLWQGQGRREEARQMLQEIYYWFTEGFDTPDLKEARALLEELS